MYFDKDGRHRSPHKREHGSSFTAEIRMTRDELKAVEVAVQKLIPPTTVDTIFNGSPLAKRTCVARFKAHLQSEVADEEGYLKRTVRETLIEVYEPFEGEAASIYEMGIPVVETGDKWHYNVMQKVPLNTDRDNVTPGWLQFLRMHVLNQMHYKISKEEATQKWVRDASADADVTPVALETVMTHRFGKKRVIYDPTDLEGNKRAASEGYTVVTGGSLSREEWYNVKRDNTMLPAGKVTPSSQLLATSPDGVDDTVPEEKWTVAMAQIADYARGLGGRLLDGAVSVKIVNRFREHHAAWYGNRVLTFNLARLGHAWFNEGIRQEVDRLLIHEFGHHASADHLSKEYHDALCKLGAKLTEIALTEPAFFHKNGRKTGA